MSQTHDCTFCRIIRGELPAQTLYQNDRAIAILDINPIHYGHVLVIPKRHCETFNDVPTEDLADLASATRVMSRAIVDALAAASGEAVVAQADALRGAGLSADLMDAAKYEELVKAEAC